MRIEPDDVDLRLCVGNRYIQVCQGQGERRGCRPSMGPEWWDAIHLFRRIGLKAIPTRRLHTLRLPTFTQMRSADREAADEYQQVTRRNPADMVALLAQKVKGVL